MVAIERLLFNIGEAANQLRAENLALSEQITDLSLIIGLRNFLAHAYSKVDEDRLLNTARENVPILKAEIEFLLEN